MPLKAPNYLKNKPQIVDRSTYIELLISNRRIDRIPGHDGMEGLMDQETGETFFVSSRELHGVIAFDRSSIP